MVAVSTFGQTLTVSTRSLATSGIPFNKAATKIAALPNGRIVTVWLGETGYTDQYGVYLTRADVFARVLNADGSFASSELTVRENVDIGSFSNGRPAPSITVLKDGRYVIGTQSRVTFVTADQGPTLQIFNADGTASSGLILLNTSLGTGWDPVLATLADGRFVAAWRPVNSTVAFRIFNANGTNSSSDIVVTKDDPNVAGLTFTYDPTITALANGGFVVAWETDLSDGSGTSIHARTYNASGTALGAEFQVNTTTASGQHEPSIAALSDGRFVMVWASQDTGDGDGTVLRGRLFDANGVASGADFIVNSTAEGDQLVPSVAALDAGRFVVVWRSTDGGTGDIDTIRARVYDANGVAAADFTVGTEAASDDEYPSVAALPDGRFAVSWWAWSGGSSVETHVQIYSVDAPHTIAGSSRNDVYFGGAAADQISGNAGNDQLSGGAGSNTIDGGGGRDVASYTVASSQAQIVHNSNGSWTVTIASLGQVDTLSNVEIAHFTDRDISLRETARADITGNGTSGMVLQNGGTVVDWVLAGGAYASGNVITSGASGFTVVGTGDFNGDGTADIVLQNGGTVVQWTMQNGVYQSGSILTTGAVGFSVKGTGDFNGDGTTDIVLQNGGTVVNWIMKDGAYQSGNVLATGLTGWSVVGTGDFNGDGTTDVLLQNGGTVVDWIMKNGAYQSGNVITTGAAGFTVVGTGDFNGDGTTDVLLQKGGTVVDWLMSNGLFQSGNTITNGATGFTVVGTGDYNGDGTADVALQNGGTVVDWIMKNGTFQSGNVLTTGATGFTVR